jgi:hypothetical protein
MREPEEMLKNIFDMIQEKDISPRKAQGIIFIMNKLYDDYEVSFPNSRESNNYAYCKMIDNDSFAVTMEIDMSSLFSAIAEKTVNTISMINIIDHYYDMEMTLMKVVKLLK